VQIEIHDLEGSDRAWAKAFLEEQSGSARVVSRGRIHYADRLAGYVGVVSGARVGLLTYTIREDELEVVSLHTTLRRHGVGTSMLEAAMKKAQAEGCRRLWLITTNDNDPAVALYRSRGMTLVAVHRGAVAESRKLKPDIPLLGLNGKPIEDELEFEILLEPAN
jgi:ribosomal protein S18 acetylase RimI-like enzyme